MSKFIRLVTKTLLPFLLIPLLNIQAFGQSVDFTQARNHFQNTYAIDWVPGILNATHTDYFEGQGICQRLIFTNIAPGSHTANLKVLANKGGKHAYDFLISWEQAWMTARDIGNGSLNELATLASAGPPVTIDEVVAWKDAVATSIKNDITGDNNATPAQLAAAFPISVRGTYTGNLNGAGINSTVQAKADCFEAIDAYGTRDFQMRGNGAFTGTPTMAFTGYSDESGDIYANYTLSWNSTSTRVVVRFAGHAAVGLGLQACIGYGQGLGAGSISGGPYHFKFLTLDGGDLNGERDNQLMSGAIKIPPLCGLTGPNEVCPEFTSPLTFNYDGGVQSAGASLTFEIVLNTAKATFASDGSVLLTKNATADANGKASVSVYPQTGGYVPGGDFQVKVTATNAGGTCSELATVTHVVKTEVTASANPTTLNVNLASQETQLDASVKQDGAAADPSGFGFQWTVDVAGVGHFVPAGANIRNPKFVIDDPAKALQVGSLTFTVTATLTDRPNSCTTCCTATSQVTIDFTGGASCPGDITGTNPVCAGGSGTYSSATLVAANNNGQFPGAGLTYTWTIVPADAGTIAGSNVNVTGITVNNITKSFKVVLTITFASGLPPVSGAGCEYNVTVNPVPTCTISGPSPVCELVQQTYTSTVDPSGGTVTHSWSVTGNATPVGAPPYNGTTFTVLPGSINNGTTFTVRDDISRNGCKSYCTKEVTIQGCGVGCTIGFWKTHPEVWNGSCTNFTLPKGTSEKPDISGLTFYTCTKFLDVFPGVSLTGLSATSTMLDVLALSGGNCQTVARQGVGALLNSIAFDGQYPYPAGTSSYSELYTLILNVLKSGSYTINGKTYTCASLAVALSVANNHEVFDKNGVSLCSGLPGTQVLPTITFRLPRTDLQQLATDNLSVTAYPNPFNSSISFNLSSAAQGKATLEIFDMLGRRLALVYKGNLEAGAPKTISYRVPNAQRVPIIYKLTLGGQAIYGKLLPTKE